MGADATLPLLKAVRDALLAATAVTDKVATRVYDNVPQQTAYPYIRVEAGAQSYFGTKSFDGGEHTLSVHCWSEYHGMKEIGEIMSAVHDALHKASMMVTGHTLVTMHVEFQDAFVEADGVTRHGVQRLRALTHA